MSIIPWNTSFTLRRVVYHDTFVATVKVFAGSIISVYRDSFTELQRMIKSTPTTVTFKRVPQSCAAEFSHPWYVG